MMNEPYNDTLDDDDDDENQEKNDEHDEERVWRSEPAALSRRRKKQHSRSSPSGAERMWSVWRRRRGRALRGIQFSRCGWDGTDAGA